MKKLLTVLTTVLIACITLRCFIACNSNNTDNYSQDLKFELNEERTGYVLTGIGNCNDTKLVVPAKHNGKPVVEIEEWAFENNDFIQELLIPDSVEFIQTQAFIDCSNLTSVVIGDGLEFIGSCAFAACTSLTSIVVSKNNTAYKSVDGNLYTKDGEMLIQYAIGKTEKSFTIPDGVTNIGEMTFLGCSSLTSINIPESVTSIGGSAFYSCSSLEGVVIGDGVEIIFDYAFADCISLTSVVIPKSVEVFSGMVFYQSHSLTNLYYKGQASDWANILIDPHDTILTNAKKYYYSENEPTEIGDYWHYDGNGNIVIWQ